MINLAENGVLCDCGSTLLAPPEITRSGEPAICSTCARAYVVAVTLLPVTWPTIQDLLEDRPSDLCAFEWHRAGVEPGQRRTLAPVDTTERTKFIDRAGTVIGLLIALAALATMVRAVLS